MIYCMKCGSKLPAEAIFCKYCGASTILTEETENNDVQAESTPEAATVETVSSPQEEEKTEIEVVEEVIATPVHKAEIETRQNPKIEVFVTVSSPNMELENVSSHRVEIIEAAPAPKVEVIETVTAPKVEIIVPAPVLSQKPVSETEPVPAPAPAPAVQTPVVPAPEPEPEPEIIETVSANTVEEIVAAPSTEKIDTESPHISEARPILPPKKNLETESASNADYTIRSTTSVPFEKHRHKSSNFYVDHDFHSGLARKNVGGTYNEVLDTMEGGKWGFVDSSRREVIPVIYDYVSVFSEGFAKVSIGGSSGIINKKGKEVIPLIYKDTTHVSEGLVGVCVNNKWGFIDIKGNKVIPIKYGNVTPFANGMAGVYKNGKWGLIDKNDRLVIPFMYHDVSQFANHKKDDNAQSEVTSYSSKGSKLHKFTLGMGKAWAALFGEIFFLFMVSKLLPKDKTNVYWMLVLITIVVSFILFYVIVTTVKGLSKEKMDV